MADVDSRTLYRYEGYVFDSDVEVYAQRYNVLKHTLLGVWIADPWSTGVTKRRFVLTSARKRYAYPTKVEALAAFRRRKQRHIEILEDTMENARAMLAKAEEMMEMEG